MEWLKSSGKTSHLNCQMESFKLPNGECLKEVQERNIEALNLILAESENQTVIIGTHGTALSTIINYYKPEFG